MREAANKITVERLPERQNLHVYQDEMALGNLSYINADDNDIEHRHEPSATMLYFIRGTGKIEINGSLMEYDGKWFEIPFLVEYQILPETDTVMLSIPKPIENADSFWRNIDDSHIVS
jgi:hypothetical protein